MHDMTFLPVFVYFALSFNLFSLDKVYYFFYSIIYQSNLSLLHPIPLYNSCLTVFCTFGKITLLSID